MSVEAGMPSAFQSTLLDNGNPIANDQPWTWETDDPTDTLTQGGGDGSTVKVVVQDPPAAGRTQITVTASTTDPKGNEVSGSKTTDIIPGIEHIFTVNVDQLFAAPKR